ncbi:MAG: hypothetical protein KJ645_12285, partial [Planctomycetes bacterium]|nr:hypothetical protein [Planctomycetota bacterium]
VGFSGDHAVLWQYDFHQGFWELVDLGLPDGYASSFAWAVNNHAQVVGWSDDGGGGTSAMIWEYNLESESWEATELGPGKAYCINDRFDIVGVSSNQATSWSYNTEEQIWSGFSLPAVLRGRSVSAAYGINKAGDIVGEMDGSAVLWSDGEVYDLNERLSPQSELFLEQAWDISESGQIVGWGWKQGDRKAFFLADKSSKYDRYDPPVQKKAIK